MNRIVIFSIAALSIFLVLSVDQEVLGYGGPPEQSSANNFTVQIYSDKESYTLGDTIIFSGTVNKYSEDRNLRISIFTSNQNFIATQKISVNEDRTFIHEIQLNEKFSNGDFLVKSQYGTKKTTVETIEGLSLYPNPVSGDKIYITSTKNLEKEIEIYNVLGKAIKKTKLRGKELDISSLVAGIYIVKIKEQNEIATRKLVVK